MLASLELLAPSLPTSLLAQALPLQPVVILVLCVIAGVGTVLLLPSRREAPMRKIGGVLLAAAGVIFAALLIRWAAAETRGVMNVYFWVFTAVALLGAVRVITHRKPVYSALYFVLTVFATAGLFVLMWAEFVAAALVIIYAGAILITYVFVIMLAAEATPVSTTESPSDAIAEHDAVSREPVLAALAGFGLMGVLLFLIFDRAQGLPERPEGAAQGQLMLDRGSATRGETVPPRLEEPGSAPAVVGHTQELGAFLFQQHFVNLQMAGLILTIAMIGAIMISRRQIARPAAEAAEQPGEMLVGPATPIDDNPHSIPVYGTDNPRQKAYPET